MQAPSFRMNEREANPNPYIAFIRSLRTKGDHTDAESILKAVAAQMKKIMEQRFMFVGTLEEAAHNPVFAGRNWNHGQSIELVLRRPNGRFLPLSYITSVMCHEMAHIEHMNHGSKFQKLMADIKSDVRAMQARGNYGDGFWSDGHRLKDNVKMGGEGLQPTDFPEYVCGVTAGDAKKARGPRRGGPGSSATPGLVKGEASTRSGRQTEYKRKAGRRNLVDMGSSGGRLDGKQTITKEDEARRKEEIAEIAEEYIGGGMEAKKAKAKAAREWKKDNAWYTAGNSRGKVAKSKSAAEMRAEAAEKRLAALKPKVEITKYESEEEDQLDSDEDELESEEEDVADPHIDPQTRKKQMEDEMSEAEKKGLRGGWEDIFPSMHGRSSGVSKKRQLSPDNDEEDDDDDGIVALPSAPAPAAKRPVARDASRFGFGKGMVDEERKRGLGLSSSSSQKTAQALGGSLNGGSSITAPISADGRKGWSCKICTFANIMDHGLCEMCGARPDGEMPEYIN